MEMRTIIVERVTDLREITPCEFLLNGQLITEESRIMDAFIVSFSLMPVVCMGSPKYFNKLSKFLRGTRIEMERVNHSHVRNGDWLFVLDLDHLALLTGTVSSSPVDLYPEDS